MKIDSVVKEILGSVEEQNILKMAEIRFDILDLYRPFERIFTKYVKSMKFPYRDESGAITNVSFEELPKKWKQTYKDKISQLFESQVAQQLKTSIEKTLDKVIPSVGVNAQKIYEMHKNSENCVMCRVFCAGVEEDRKEYDEEVHPENRKFWKDVAKHPESALGKHPVLTLEGEDLDRASYKHTKGLVKKFDVKPEKLSELFQQMMMIEHKHKDALEKLAIRAVAKMMGVHESELSAKMSDDVDVNDTEALSEDEMKAMPKRLLDEANKRVTSNAFAQGASVHAYLTAHFLDEIESAIKKIDPKLIDIYSKISTGSHHLYWIMNMSEMDLAGSAVGSVKPEQDEDGEIKMKAVSPTFIVLVQELVKGVLELRYLKGLQNKKVDELSDEDIKTIYQYADKIKDEPRLIQVGPELWRRFLKVVSGSNVKKKPVEVYEHLMKLAPKELHSFVQLVVSEPEKASKELKSLLDDSELWKEDEKEDTKKEWEK